MVIKVFEKTEDLNQSVKSCSLDPSFCTCKFFGLYMVGVNSKGSDQIAHMLLFLI